MTLGAGTSSWRAFGTRSDASVTNPLTSAEGHALPLSVNVISKSADRDDDINPAIVNCLGGETAAGIRKECVTYTATVTFPRPEINPVVTFGSGTGLLENDSMGCFATWADLEFSKINGVAPAPGQVSVLSAIALDQVGGTYRSATPSFADNRLSASPLVASHPGSCAPDASPPLTALQVNGLVSSITFAIPTVTQITKTLATSQAKPAVEPNITFGFSFPSADLSVVKTGPATADGKGSIDWTLKVVNAGGSSDAHGLLIHDAVPPEVTDPKIVKAPAGCSLSGHDLVCAFAPPGYIVNQDPTVATIAHLTGGDSSGHVPSALAAGESVTIELSGTAPLSSEGGIVNTATVSGTDIDPKTTNNTGTVTTTITPSTWTLTKTATVNGTTPAGGLVKPGDVITYRVTATATHGPVPGIVLTDDLSAVLDHAHFVAGSAHLIIADGPPQAIADPSAVAPARLSTPSFDLEDGQYAELIYQVKVDADAWLASLKNSVTGSADVPLTSCSPCTTTSVTGAQLFVQKNGSDKAGNTAAMAGSAFQILADEHGKPGEALTGMPVSPVAGQTGLFEIRGLMPGTYWLNETKAPSGHTLLARPAAFTVDPSGTITLVNPAADPDVAVSRNVLTVHDAPAAALPFTGGIGFGVYAAAGGAALVAAIAIALLLRRRSSTTT